jgi:hypothetical protein
MVQLRVMARRTGEKIFSDFADRWEGYSRKAVNRNVALAYKAVFKLVYY